MVIVLPDADDGLAVVEDRLAESYDRWLSGLTLEEVDLEIPRWKTISDEMNLGDHLRSLGMQLAFSDAADFSAMTTQEKLHISLVIQKAFVQVTEEGTEAAAATAVIMMGVSATMTPQFHADHPFLYFIRDPETGLVLFMGRVLDPG
jgi:serpin B